VGGVGAGGWGGGGCKSVIEVFNSVSLKI